MHNHLFQAFKCNILLLKNCKSSTILNKKMTVDDKIEDTFH